LLRPRRPQSQNGKTRQQPGEQISPLHNSNIWSHPGRSEACVSENRGKTPSFDAKTRT
jgi:hypothetical protein